MAGALRVIDSGPGFSDLAQIRAAQIFGRHGNPVLDIGIEDEEPRLREYRNFGCIFQIDTKL
jgi:hypothetical protein